MLKDLLQKDNIQAIISRVRPVAAKLVNKSGLIVNLLIGFFLIFQMVDFYQIYSVKGTDMFNQARVMNIHIKDNSLELNDITGAEFEKLRNEYLRKIAPDPEDFIGPMPEIKPEDFVGPMPFDASKEPVAEPEIVAEEKKPEEEKPTQRILTPEDYKIANLSIIVTEIGMKKDELDGARVLPKEVSFAFSPYADELQSKIDFATRDGRQVLLNVIFNPSNYPMKDGGPLSIQANYDEVQNLALFGTSVNVAKNYTGLLANNDEIITSRFDKISPLLKKITEKNVFFGFFRTTTNANLENDAKPFATDTFAVDYLIDEELDEEKIKAQLNLIKEDIVIKKKRLVIATTPSPLSVRLLKEWLDENMGSSVHIAPISYFITNN